MTTKIPGSGDPLVCIVIEALLLLQVKLNVNVDR
jgi:hypothetical protein